MTGKDILDKCSQILKRQDLDRDLLLFYVNSTRKAIFRNQYIYKFNQYLKDVLCTDGVVSLPTLKNAMRVEYVATQTDGSTLTNVLTKLPDYGELMDIQNNAKDIGMTQYYFVLGTEIHVAPVPISGQINIYGEFYPSDIQDSDAYTDITTTEIPDILIYLGVGEYFDMLDETDRGDKYRNKAGSLLSEYFKEIKRQQTTGLDLMARDPFGNLGNSNRKQGMYSYDELTIDSMDGGGF